MLTTANFVGKEGALIVVWAHADVLVERPIQDRSRAAPETWIIFRVSLKYDLVIWDDRPPWVRKMGSAHVFVVMAPSCMMGMSFGRGRIESGKMAPEIQASIQIVVATCLHLPARTASIWKEM